jgi:hypothetical protein
MAMFLALAICTTALANPSNKWRLEFSGGSRSAGVIVIELTPVGADQIKVAVDVPNDTSENNVAKTVTAALQKALPGDAYHVERDDGEDVLIKARHGAADFTVVIVSNTVEHVRINLDRE